MECISLKYKGEVTHKYPDPTLDNEVSYILKISKLQFRYTLYHAAVVQTLFKYTRPLNLETCPLLVNEWAAWAWEDPHLVEEHPPFSNKYGWALDNVYEYEVCEITHKTQIFDTIH